MRSLLVFPGKTETAVLGRVCDLHRSPRRPLPAVAWDRNCTHQHSAPPHLSSSLGVNPSPFHTTRSGCAMGEQAVLRCDWRLLWLVITDVIAKGLFHANTGEPVSLPPPTWRDSKLLWVRVRHCDILLWSVLMLLSVLGGWIFAQSAIYVVVLVLCCQGVVLFA